VPADKGAEILRESSSGTAVDKVGASSQFTDLKSDAQLMAAIDGLLLSRRVGNCTERTVGFYQDGLLRFARSGAMLTCDTLVLQRYFTHLRERMRPITTHGHFRVLQVFFGWAVQSGLLTSTPMRGLTMRKPQLLPRVPEDEHIRKLLATCADTFEGRRNKALVALLADGGLRISEALRLRIEDVRLGERTLTVHGGKGQKDGTGFLGAETTKLLREWLQTRQAQPEDFVFTDRHGRPLSRSHACHILHRLSVKAQLPRKIGPCLVPYRGELLVILHNLDKVFDPMLVADNEKTAG